MPEIGLFPLELVLLPSERVPLHIFEDRYKELISECLEGGSEFGLILETGDRLAEIGTLTGVIEVIHTFDDGRMNVLVEGRGRFRLSYETDGRSYRTAEIQPLEDDDEPPTDAEIDEALASFRRLAKIAEADDLQEPAEGAALSFQLASKVDFGHELKQELLELRSERQRLVRLAELLEKAVAGLTREREVRERASGNGKVTSHVPDDVGHQDRVDELLATAVLVLPVALLDEAELLVQAHRRLVVREDMQLELRHARLTSPGCCLFEQRPADALAARVCGDHQPEVGDMAAGRVRVAGDREAADDPALVFGDEDRRVRVLAHGAHVAALVGDRAPAAVRDQPALGLRPDRLGQRDEKRCVLRIRGPYVHASTTIP